MTLSTRLPLLLGALAAFGAIDASPAHAAGCPAGYTQVGVKKTETATAVISQPICRPDVEIAACTNLESEIDSVVSAAGRASLALDVYSLYEKPAGERTGWKAPPGFTLLSGDMGQIRKLFPGLGDSEIAAELAPSGSKFRAAIYRDDRTQVVLLVFRGTTEGAGDWTANIPNELGLWTDYFARARSLGRTLQRSANLHGLKLEIVGHSLGGGLASAAALAARAKATVFNAESFRSDTFEGAKDGDAALTRSLVTNYVTPGEALTAYVQGFIRPSQGYRVTLPDWPGSPLDPFERHKMRNVRLALQHDLEVLRKKYDDEDCAP